MPFVFCEVCDYMGKGKTPQDRLLDVIRHEEKEHNRCDIAADIRPKVSDDTFKLESLYEQSLKDEDHEK